jgi:pyruvate carboxylase subunit B
MKKYTVEVAGRTLTVEVDGSEVRLEGHPVDARLGGSRGDVRRRIGNGARGREFVVAPGAERGQWRLSTAGHRFDVQVLDERARAVRAAGGGATQGAGILKAPMPGLVVRVLVAEGDPVEAGKGLVVVEAMKMENELKAGGNGTVKKVLAKPGDRVEKGAPLIEIA